MWIVEKLSYFKRLSSQTPQLVQKHSVDFNDDFDLSTLSDRYTMHVLNNL